MGSCHPARLIDFPFGRISPSNQASRLNTPVTTGNLRDHHPSISPAEPANRPRSPWPKGPAQDCHRPVQKFITNSNRQVVDTVRTAIKQGLLDFAGHIKSLQANQVVSWLLLNAANVSRAYLCAVNGAIGCALSLCKLLQTCAKFVLRPLQMQASKDAAAGLLNPQQAACPQRTPSYPCWVAFAHLQ